MGDEGEPPEPSRLKSVVRVPEPTSSPGKGKMKVPGPKDTEDPQQHRTDFMRAVNQNPGPLVIHENTYSVLSPPDGNTPRVVTQPGQQRQHHSTHSTGRHTQGKQPVKPKMADCHKHVSWREDSTYEKGGPSGTRQDTSKTAPPGFVAGQVRDIEDRVQMLEASVESLICHTKDIQRNVQGMEEQQESGEAAMANLADTVCTVNERTSDNDNVLVTLSTDMGDVQHWQRKCMRRYDEMEADLQTLRQIVKDNSEQQDSMEKSIEQLLQGSKDTSMATDKQHIAAIQDILARAERDGINSCFDKLHSYLTNTYDQCYERQGHAHYTEDDATRRPNVLFPRSTQQRSNNAQWTWQDNGNRRDPYPPGLSRHEEVSDHSVEKSVSFHPSVEPTQTSREDGSRGHRESSDAMKQRQYRTNMRTQHARFIKDAFPFTGKHTVPPLERLKEIDDYLSNLVEEDIWDDNPATKDMQRGTMLLAADVKGLALGKNLPTTWSGIQERLQDHYQPRRQELTTVLNKLKYEYPLDHIEFLKDAAQLFKDHNCVMSTNDLHAIFTKLDDEGLLAHMDTKYFGTPDIQGGRKEATLEELIIHIKSYRTQFQQTVQQYHNNHMESQREKNRHLARQQERTRQRSDQTSRIPWNQEGKDRSQPRRGPDGRFQQTTRDRPQFDHSQDRSRDRSYDRTRDKSKFQSRSENKENRYPQKGGQPERFSRYAQSPAKDQNKTGMYAVTDAQGLQDSPSEEDHNALGANSSSEEETNSEYSDDSDSMGAIWDFQVFETLNGGLYMGDATGKRMPRTRWQDTADWPEVIMTAEDVANTGNHTASTDPTAEAELPETEPVQSETTEGALKASDSTTVRAGLRSRSTALVQTPAEKPAATEDAKHSKKQAKRGPKAATKKASAEKLSTSVPKNAEAIDATEYQAMRQEALPMTQEMRRVNDRQKIQHMNRVGHPGLSAEDNLSRQQITQTLGQLLHILEKSKTHSPLLDGFKLLVAHTEIFAGHELQEEEIMDSIKHLMKKKLKKGDKKKTCMFVHMPRFTAHFGKYGTEAGMSEAYELDIDSGAPNGFISESKFLEIAPYLGTAVWHDIKASLRAYNGTAVEILGFVSGVSVRLETGDYMTCSFVVCKGEKMNPHRILIGGDTLLRYQADIKYRYARGPHTSLMILRLPDGSVGQRTRQIEIPLTVTSKQKTLAMSTPVQQWLHHKKVKTAPQGTSILHN